MINQIQYSQYKIPSNNFCLTPKNKQTSANSEFVSFKGLNHIPPCTYFIRMATYQRNGIWNKKMISATETISDMIKRNFDISKIIEATEAYVNRINSKNGQPEPGFGLKKKIKGGCFDILNYSDRRGFEYYARYRTFLAQKCTLSYYNPKANETYKDAITCKIYPTNHTISVIHAGNNRANIESNLELVKRAYSLLKEKPNPTKKEIVDTAATIQWLIAQETPYMRGSDSVANLLTRSLLHSYGIELSPVKAGKSCDFEAFYRDLDDFIKIYPDLFEKPLI